MRLESRSLARIDSQHVLLLKGLLLWIVVAFAAVSRIGRHPIGQLRVVCHGATGIAISAEVFAGVKGEGRGVGSVGACARDGRKGQRAGGSER